MADFSTSMPAPGVYPSSNLISPMTTNRAHAYAYKVSWTGSPRLALGWHHCMARNLGAPCNKRALRFATLIITPTWSGEG
jgi:hypothetical protein